VRIRLNNFPDFVRLGCCLLFVALCSSASVIFFAGDPLCVMGACVCLSGAMLWWVTALQRQSHDHEGIANLSPLRDSALWKSVINRVPHLVWMTHGDATPYLWNDRWLHYCGAAPQTKTQWVDFLHPDDRARASRVWSASLATGAAYHVEFRLRRVDGVYRWHLARGCPVRDAAQKVHGWFGTCTDIHEQKVAGAALAQSCESALLNLDLVQRLRRVLEAYREVSATPLDPQAIMAAVVRHVSILIGPADGTCILRLEGNQLTFQSVSERAGDLFGLHLPLENSLSGRALTQRMTLMATRSSTDERVNRAAATQVGVMSFFAVPFMIRNEYVGVLGCYSRREDAFAEEHLRTAELLAALLSTLLGQAEEFQEKKHAIETLRATEKNLIQARQQADASTQAKAAFLADMSHKIRIPLSGVLGITELLASTHLHADQKKHVQLIRQSGQSLMAIVDDILEFSKSEAGKLVLDDGAFSPHNCVEAVVLPLKSRAEDKGLRLDLHFYPNLPLRLRGDARRMGQVLGNLLSNAIKFTVQGNISVEVSEKTRHRDSVVLQFTIKDTGIGMTLEEQNKLFVPYAQGGTKVSRNFGGTGLGLSICRQLVDLMGGALGVSSQPGRGSTFWFCLPFALVSSRKLVSDRRLGAAEETRPTSAYLILVVDDHGVNQMLTLSFLEQLGYRAEAAFNGEEALVKLKEKQFDLILMDCQMPKIDGFAAARFIRAQKHSAFRCIPIVALTAGVLPADLERCRQAGMDAHLGKPLGKNELAQTLAKFLP
jgi:PAS domain S-box-containing protein